MVSIEILKAFMGIITALVWSAIGYAVAKRSGEDFDANNFGKTVLIGFILGILAILAGVNTTEVEGYTTLQLVTVFVDKAEALIEKPKTPPK